MRLHVTCLGLVGLILASPCNTLHACVVNDVEILVKQLRSSDTFERRKAAAALGELGSQAQAAIPELCHVLSKEKDIFVRRAAARSLGQIASDPQRTLAALSKSLKDENREVAEAAAEAMTKFGPDAVSYLTQGLKDRDQLVQKLCVVSLGKLGSAAKPSVQPLIKLFQEQPTMRRRDQETLRGVIVETLGKIGPGAKDALPIIEASLENNRDREYRRVAEMAIRRINRSN